MKTVHDLVKEFDKNRKAKPTYDELADALKETLSAIRCSSVIDEVVGNFSISLTWEQVNDICRRANT